MAKKRKKRSFSWQGALAGLGQGMVQNSQQAARAAQQQQAQQQVFQQQLQLDQIRAQREAERNRVLDARAEQDFLLRQQGLQATQDYQGKMLEGTLGNYKADNDRLQQELNWKIEQANRLEAQRKADEAEALEFNADLAYGSEPVALPAPPVAPPANAVQPPMAGVMGGAPASKPLFALPPNVGPAPEAPAPPIAPLPAAGGMPMGAMPAPMPAQQAEMPALPPYQAYQRRPYPKSADKPHERITWDQNEDRLEKQHNDNFDRQVNYAKTAKDFAKPGRGMNVGAILNEHRALVDGMNNGMISGAELAPAKQRVLQLEQALAEEGYKTVPTANPDGGITNPMLQKTVQGFLTQGENPALVQRALEIMREAQAQPTQGQ